MAAGRVHARGPTLLVLACALSSGRSDDIQPAVTGSALVSELGACETEACASAALDASGGAVQSLPPADIETVAVDLVSRSFWEPAHALLDIARAVGVPVAQFDRLRRQLTREREESTKALTQLRASTAAEQTTVSCAFEWAQSREAVYINAKFSSRIDGPVTVLNVDEERVSFEPRALTFDARGRQKPKRFKLELELLKEIEPSSCEWSFSSVGRISFTLAKKEPGMWSRLLAGRTKPKNMHTWLSRQQLIDAEQRKQDEAAKAAANGNETAKPASPSASPSSPEAGAGKPRGSGKKRSAGKRSSSSSRSSSPPAPAAPGSPTSSAGVSSKEEL